jgi:hypothetical protein
MTLSFVAKRPNIVWSVDVSNNLFTKVNNLLLLILKVTWLLMTDIVIQAAKKCRSVRKRVRIVHRLPTRSSAREYGAWCWNRAAGRKDVCSSRTVACWTSWAPAPRNCSKRDRVHYTWRAYRRVLVLAQDFCLNQGSLIDWIVRGKVCLFPYCFQ